MVGRARALTALGLLAALPGCATDHDPAPSLSAEVRQYRSDVPLRMLSVTTTSTGSADVTIERVQLLAHGFVALPAAPSDVLLRAGDRVDVPVAYGPARCGSALPDAADAARMTLRPSGGEPVEVVVPLSPAGGLLARLHASECAQQALRDAVQLTLGPSWVRRGDRLEGSLLVVRRSGDAPVEVLEPGGHIVFTVRAALPAELAPGRQQLTVPLTLTPTRCDGHALSENSRAGVFPFVVRLGDAEPVQTPAVAGPELRAQLQAFAADVCLPAG